MVVVKHSCRIRLLTTRATRIPVLEPCSTNIRVLLIDNVLYVLELFLHVVRVHYTCDPCTNAKDPNLSNGRRVSDDIWDLILGISWHSIVGIAVSLIACESVNIWRHDGQKQQ